MGKRELLHFVLKKRTPASKLGRVRNVVVKDVTAHVQGTTRILGHAERPLENITLSGLQLVMPPGGDARTSAPPTGCVVEGVDRLRIRDLELRWAEEPVEPKWQSALVAAGRGTSS